MIVNIVLQQCKRFTRSNRWKSALILKIIFSMILLSIILQLLAVGYFADTILQNKFPNISPVKIVNSYILYYFEILLIIRFLFQKVAPYSISPYLILNVRKYKIVNLYLLRMIFNRFNLITISIFTPFAVKIVSKNYSYTVALLWLLNIFLFMLINNYLIVFLKGRLDYHLKTGFFFLMIYAIIYSFNYYGLINLSVLSLMYFDALLMHSHFVFIPFLILFGIYILNFKFLLDKLYLDRINLKTRKNIQLFKIIERQKALRMFTLEIKSIYRNKMMRKNFFGSFLQLVIGLIFLFQAIYGNYPKIMKIFSLCYGGFILTGYPLYYLSLCLSSVSSYFDFLKANKFPLEYFIITKYLFSVILSTFGLVTGLIILSLAKKEYITFILILYLTNIGFMFPFIILDSLRIKYSMFKGYNITLSGLIVGIVYIVLPSLLIVVFSGTLVLTILALLGSINIILLREWLNIIITTYNNEQYNITEKLRGTMKCV